MELYNGDFICLTVFYVNLKVWSATSALVCICLKNFCPACLDDRLVSAHCYEN